MTTSTVSGEAISELGMSEDQAAETFLERFLPKKGKDAEDQPSEKDAQDQETTDEQEQDQEVSEETPETEGDDEGSEGETKDKAKLYVEDDEAFVKVKIGDEEVEVAVKDLKRLHGQEASLTRKSQEVADKRKALDTEAARNVAVLNVLNERAKAKADEFRKIDFLLLSRDPNFSSEDLTALRNEAQRAFDEERFLSGELGTFMQAIQVEQKKAIATQAAQTIKILSDPGSADKPNPFHIKDWSEKVYDEIRTFAVTSGLDAEVVNQIVDPAAIKLLHDAMQFRRGASKVVTEKVNKQPTKIVKKTQGSAPPSTSKAAKVEKAMKTLAVKGSTDAAAEALLARWSNPNSDD